MFKSNPVKNLSIRDRLVWSVSLLLVSAAFAAAGSRQPLTLAASLIGVTALIFTAKGDVWGQLLIFIFSMLYGFISLSCRYYGEMLTYMGMTAPMALMSIISWLRNPYASGKNEVRVARMSLRDACFMLVSAAAVTAAFFFLLRALNTANLLFSTISVTTSFTACFLTWRRSSAYALAYAANDLVLIVLWVSACAADISYVPVAVCFCVFFFNDLYGFFSWRKMRARQEAG